MRIGHGYDVHRLVEDRKLIMGGVEIPWEKGLLGHSDADVLLHAIADAILGAIGEGDIGLQRCRQLKAAGTCRETGGGARFCPGKSGCHHYCSTTENGATYPADAGKYRSCAEC